MQEFIRRVTCDRCSRSMKAENNVVKTLNNKNYDLCPNCYRYVDNCMRAFVHDMLNGNYDEWFFDRFKNPEGRPIE